MEESLQRAREEYGKEGAVVSLGTQQLSDLYLPSPLTTSETTRAPRDHLVDLAHEIQHADATLRASASGKLQTIVDQMRALQEEAKKVLAATARDAKLHQAACNFKKHPGRVYHLYCKAVVDTDDGTATKSPYISMLGPDDWGSSGPGAAHEFQGSFRLEVCVCTEEEQERVLMRSRSFQRDLVHSNRFLSLFAPSYSLFSLSLVSVRSVVDTRQRNGRS